MARSPFLFLFKVDRAVPGFRSPCENPLYRQLQKALGNSKEPKEMPPLETDFSTFSITYSSGSQFPLERELSLSGVRHSR